MLLLAAFQVAAAAFVPVADAMLEAAASQPLHIEAERAASCGAGHDHEFCQLCRTLAVAGVVRDVVARTCHPPQAQPVPEVPLEGLAKLSYLDSSGPAGPRPPPLV
ncbi:MAG: hypothetical protein AB7T31_12985 [Gemmatimonadales bacterium]